jgi:hypothetical protein
MRKFFLTRSGAIGIGPFVFALQRCLSSCVTVPYVIRPVKDQPGKYILLGECYVHGIMDGETIGCLRDCGELEANTQWITLSDDAQ